MSSAVVTESRSGADDITIRIQEAWEAIQVTQPLRAFSGISRSKESHGKGKRTYTFQKRQGLSAELAGFPLTWKWALYTQLTAKYFQVLGGKLLKGQKMFPCLIYNCLNTKMNWKPQSPQLTNWLFGYAFLHSVKQGLPRLPMLWGQQS